VDLDLVFLGTSGSVPTARRGLAGPGGEKATELDEYLEPLGGAVFWGEGSGGVQRFSVFVSIE